MSQRLVSVDGILSYICKPKDNKQIFVYEDISFNIYFTACESIYIYYQWQYCSTWGLM